MGRQQQNENSKRFLFLKCQRYSDCFAELENVKQDMNNIYKEKCKFKIDKIRGIEIDDSTCKIRENLKINNKSGKLRFGICLSLEHKMWLKPLRLRLGMK